MDGSDTLLMYGPNCLDSYLIITVVLNQEESFPIYVQKARVLSVVSGKYQSQIELLYIYIWACLLRINLTLHTLNL